MILQVILFIFVFIHPLSAIIEHNRKRMSEVDTRLRIGEALAIVVRRCGDALVLCDTLLPPLLSLLREPRAPVILRTSAISLLSGCLNTCAGVVERYTDGIAEGMLDLVLVEMTVATPTPRPTAKVNEKVWRRTQT
ncbi:hypothetical protein BDR06DRAFT_1015155 [Suillus hirtellus]|nr:hypothetical protein BDR06DRAFT_1015155 [Suillus hirtellus]